MATEMNRRSFVKSTLLTSAGLAMSVESRGQNATAPTANPPSAQPGLAKGKIGKLEISRIILGGNLLTHYTYSRDMQYLYNLVSHYNMDEKIMETLALAETTGINTLSMPNPRHVISAIRRYRRERGGKIQWIICPTAPVTPDMGEYRRRVEELLKDGCEAFYLWGVHADSLVAQGKYDLVAQAVALPKEYGVPSGVGAHALDVVKACEKHGIEADFYNMPFPHCRFPTGPKPDEVTTPYNEFPGYWCREPEETIEVMKAVKKPWIAFKTMASEAIPPKQPFHYEFSSGADFVLAAGLIDFEIAEDVKTAMETLVLNQERPRPWMA